MAQPSTAMDFDEDGAASPTEQAEESYLFNEEGNQIVEDVDAEGDADADGEDDEGAHSDDPSDDQRSVHSGTLPRQQHTL